ncbi:SRPBCC family protein [Tsukamurella soli]|uniref:SRPBCC family protein n=1 Tax=Tsukamurella soli TaxID=644556 RepID=UPI00360911B9
MNATTRVWMLGDAPEPRRIFTEAGWTVSVAGPGAAAPAEDVDLVFWNGADTTRESRTALVDRYRSGAPLAVLGQSQATALTGVYYPRGRFPYRQRVLIERNLYIGAKESDDAALAHRIVAEFSPPLFDITVTQFVAAPRAILYDHISDITHMGELSPENVRTRWLQKGHRFVGTNRIGAFYRWTMRGTIDEASPEKRSDSSPIPHPRPTGATPSPMPRAAPSSPRRCANTRHRSGPSSYSRTCPGHVIGDRTSAKE